MARKMMLVTNIEGRAIRTSIGAKSVPTHIIDPVGVLTVSHRPGAPGLSAVEQAAFSEYRRKVESGEIVIEFP